MHALLQANIALTAAATKRRRETHGARPHTLINIIELISSVTKHSVTAQRGAQLPVRCGLTDRQAHLSSLPAVERQQLGVS